MGATKKQARPGLSWVTLNHSGVRPWSSKFVDPKGPALVLLRQHDQPAVKIQIFIEWVQKGLDWGPNQGLTGTGTADVVITLGDIAKSDRRYSQPDSTVKTKSGTKPLSDAKTPDPDGFNLAFQHKNRSNSLLPNDVWFPCPITPHDKRTGIVVRVVVGDAEVTSLGLTLELFTRRANWRQKMEGFLEWQDKLVYGPPSGVLLIDGRYYSRRLWGEPPKSKPPKPPKPPPPPMARLLSVSASGNEGPCYVCSPLANAFMAYWCNYHDSTWRAVNAAGSDANAIASAYKPFLTEDLVPPPAEQRSAAELAALPVPEREDRVFTITQGGALAPMVSGKTSVKAGELVAWDPEKENWAVVKATKGGKWSWRTFHAEASKADPGDVFLCDTKTHVWLMVVLGSGPHTVKQKFIFGTGEDGCAPGVYRIHAAPAVPLPAGFAKYYRSTYRTAKLAELKPGVDSAKAEVETKEKALAEAKSTGASTVAPTAALKVAKADLAARKALYDVYEDAKELADLEAYLLELSKKTKDLDSETTVPYSTIREKLAAGLKKVNEDATLDGLQAFGGTDLTIRNAELRRARGTEKGPFVLDHGAGVAIEYRVKTAKDEAFEVRKVKRFIDDETGWLKPLDEAVRADKLLRELATHDVRPIESE